VNSNNFYVDGNLVLSGDHPGGLPAIIGTNFRIGTSTANENFTGGLDEVLITSTALTQGQILSLYTSGAVNNGASSLPTTTPVTIASGGSLDLNGEAQQIASLSDGAPGSGGAIFNSSPTATAVLTISSTGGSTTFSGIIDGSAGTLGLVMAGSGTQVLSGTNTFTGGTTVNSGTLIVNNVAGLLDNSNLYVGDPMLLPLLPAAVVPAAASAVAPVPEPGTVGLLAAGVAAAALAVRSRKRSKKVVKH
jgi:autotransporter-associated beta strand protein